MYYKVLQSGLIVDAWSDPDFVTYRPNKGRFILIEKTDNDDGFSKADGVVLPGGSDTWMLEQSDFRIEGKEVVKLVEIGEAEYTQLIEQLEAEGGGIREPEPEEPEQPEEQPPEEEPEEQPEEMPEPPKEEPILTRAELQKLVMGLQQQLQEEKERNDMLEGCVLEMSEVVYE